MNFHLPKRLLGVLLPAFLLALSLTGTASAQMDKAQARLYHRATDAGVEVALEIKMDRDWHIFHSELGPPDAVGIPTTVSIEADDVTFGDVWFPEPHRVVQDLGYGEPTWILQHENTLVLYAFGEWDDEADLGVELFANIEGQTCSTVDGSCIPYSVAGLESRGDGKAKYFDAFPAELRPELEASAEAGETDGVASGAEIPVFDFGFSDLRAVANLNHRIVGNKIHAVVTIDIAPDWHLYSDELGPPDAIGQITTFEMKPLDGEVVWEDPVFPEAHRSEQPWGLEGDPTWIWTHDGRMVVTVTGTFEGAAPSDLDVHISGQTCSDVTGSCEQYEDAVASAGLGTNAMFAGFAMAATVDDTTTGAMDSTEPVETEPGLEAAAGVVGAAGTGAETKPRDAKGKQNLWYFLTLCVGGGIFTLLMPCTYPMIPITISFFTKQGEKTGKAPVALSLAYGGGIVLIFVLTGAVFGEVIIQFAAHWITNLVIGSFFVYFAMVLLGVINLNPPRFLMSVAGSASNKGGLLGVFLMGATLVITSFTCTAPIVGSILSVGAKGDLPRLIMGMATFGLTMAIPFVVLSMVPGKLKSIPSSGQWMNTMKKTLGFVELAAAFKFFSMVDVAFQAGAMPDEALLILWIAMFVATSAYLFGFIMKDSAKIGGGRRFTGAAFLLLAGYSSGILFGLERGTVMTAFLPGYTNNWVGAMAPVGDRHYVTDIDNEDVAAYDRALAQAIDEDKLLLVNFTGYT